MAGRRVTTYGALADALREAIRSQEYGENDRLPTEAELAASRGVSRQTVRRAMQELVAEGLVYRVPGRGTYPVGHAERYLRHLGSIEDLMSLSLDTDCEIIEPLAPAVDAEAAARLRLEGDTVWRLSLVRRLGSSPFCHTVVALPPDVGARLEKAPELTTVGARSRVTVIGLLDRASGREIRDAEQGVAAVPAGAEVVARLGLAEAVPVLRIDRLYFDTAGDPVELAISHFDPEHYTYRVRLRRHG